MFKFLKKLFSSNNSNIDSISKPSPTTLNDLDFLDTVWIGFDNNIYEGFVWEKTKNQIFVLTKDYIDGEDEHVFEITRPYTQTKLTSNNKILYFNLDEASHS